MTTVSRLGISLLGLLILVALVLPVEGVAENSAPSPELETAAAALSFGSTAEGMLGDMGVSVPELAGVVQGTVRNADTGQPVVGAQVSVVGTQMGTITGSQGNYRIERLPAGSHQISVQYLGFTSRTEQVTVADGEEVTLDFDLRRSIIDVQEVVVTGVADATPRAKLPFTVDRLTSESLPVPASTAGGILQGKVAGATVMQGSPRPGSAPSIMLRAPTAINATGRSQEPLYIVDGNILGEGLVDLDALDIESIEVVKGSAASSLYGSRAGNGVIQITTRRGTGAADVTRYSVRSEMGQSGIRENFDITTRHIYQMTEDGQQFIDGTTGQPCTFSDCNSLVLAGQRAGPGQGPNAWNTFHTQPYPQVFDNVGAVFNQGGFQQHSATVSGRSGTTNYHLSFSQMRDQGIVVHQDGFKRNNFRLNLDQSFRPDLSVSASAFLSQSRQDLQVGHGGVFHRVVRQPVGGDITQRDADGNYRLLVDPVNKRDNPMIELSERDWYEERNRIMASSQARYEPFSWGHLEAGVSIDRIDRDELDFRDRGYPTDRPEPVNDGELRVVNSFREAINANVDVVLRRTWGDFAGRVRGRWLYEDDALETHTVHGFDLAAAGVQSVENLQDPNRINLSHNRQAIRSEGFFLNVGGDLRDRYIVDALVRRDGSSLFGSEERWQTYLRLAGAWRMTEEEWFPIEQLDEFKLRYSYGEAGGRPNFWAQYETFAVGGGVVRPLTLGNRDLRPEFIAEHEAGIDLVAMQRLSLNLTYARSTADDQILPVPLPAATGYQTQWRNIGTLESNTAEVTLGLETIRRDEFSWTNNLTFDRTRQKVTRLGEGVEPFTTGTPGQDMGGVFFVREGEALGTFYGQRYVTQCDELAHDVRQFCSSHFDVNDDGVLVFVGEGNTWRSGHWGSEGEVAGHTFRWGTPIEGALGIDHLTGEETTYLPLGNTTPDFTLNWASTAQWRNWSVYGLFSWVQGVDVFNRTVSWSMLHHMSRFQEQVGKPEDEMKPVGYYDQIQGMGFWVEDASYQKLREVSVSYEYRPTGGLLGGFDALNLSMSGRNLFTWTGYRGYDPDVGIEGGETGSAILGRSDLDGYPSFRTWTFAAELVF